jgi:hypothetical protein
MAINSSNSNFVNISNLPQTQVAVGGDLLVLQTENGTQTIDFGNFNVVRTDVAGNATVVGEITGTNAFFNNVAASTSISAVNFASQGARGFNAVSNFYNRFTVNGGLCTSATYVSNGSPDFVNITGTILPNLTSWLSTVFTVYLDITGVVRLAAGQDSFGASLNTSPYINIDTSITNRHFYVTTQQRISSVPWVDNFSWNNNLLQFNVYLGYPAPAGGLDLTWRCLYPVASNQIPF